MGKTLSFGKGKGNIRHNNRDYFTPNVDKSRTPDNVILKQQSIEDAYEHLFGKAIEDYNATQKRSDRKKTVEGYMDEIRRNQSNRNGEKLFYEQVIGVGDMYDTGILTSPEDAQTAKQILLDYMKEWQERNPHLYVFNAVLHMDESTPHLHVDYIPYGEGYKQGVQRRNSLTKAHENMGIKSAKSKADNSTKSWIARERGRITEIAKRHGVEIDTLGIKRKDYTLDEYKVLTHDEKKALKHYKAPRPNRVKLPFNMALEVDRRQVDKYLDYKTEVKSHAETYKKATQTAENVQKHAQDGLKEVKALKLSLELEKAENKAKYADIYQEYREAKEAYSYEYERQRNLNQEHEQLQKDYKGLSAELQESHVQNGTLRAEIADLRRSTEERIEIATKDLKDEIQALKEQVEVLEVEKEDIATSVLSITKAVSQLKTYCNPGTKPYRLCEGVEKYSRHWLKNDGYLDKAEKVGIAEIVDAIRKFVSDPSGKTEKPKKRSYEPEH